jgi:hypothetical protein
MKPTPEEIAQLKADIEAANIHAGSAIEFTVARMKSCIAIGERLNAWKKGIPHGQWQKFIADEIDGIQARAIQRWQKLASLKASGALDIESANGLRSAYMLAGILPANEPKEPSGNSEDDTAGWLVHLTRLTRSLSKVAKVGPSASQIEDIKLRIAPLRLVLQSIDRGMTV